MALLIDNDTSARVLEMPEAVSAIEDAFIQLGEGDATFQPRTDIYSPTATDGSFYAWGSLLGAIRRPPRLAFRFKSDVLDYVESDGRLTEEKFNVTPGTFMGFILLFDTATGELLGLLNDGVIQHYRVGATAGVACKHLSRADASVVGVLGSGGMARTYVQAFCAVRDVTHLKVYSPTVAHREAYAAEMRETLGLAVTPVDTPEEAMRDVDIAATCTDSTTPVYDHEWLRDGLFLVDARANEMDDETFDRVDRVVATWNQPYTDYVVGDRPKEYYREKRGSGSRTKVPMDGPTLPDVLTGAEPPRRDDGEQIYYYNRSSGIQFAAAANLVYESTVERGLGVEVPLGWFQQDIRN